MTALSDLAGAFAERELTVPVSCGGSSTRAFFDRAGTIRKIGGGQVQIEHDTLYIAVGALAPDLVQEARILVGPLGVETAESDDGVSVWYRVSRAPQLQDDGMLQSFAIGGGAS